MVSRWVVPGQRLWFAYDGTATGMTGHPDTVVSGSFEEVEQFRITFVDTLSSNVVLGPSYWWSTTSDDGHLQRDEEAQWSVGTDYDSYWTDVAGPPGLIAELADHPGLETYRFTWDAS